MATPITIPNGYSSRTITYKTVGELNIQLDVLFPSTLPTTPIPALIHYHGGFLVVGNRYSFMPYWLLNACASRRWIFVTPDYRLIPETTAHDSVSDAVDAYQWVLTKLPTELSINIGPIALAGSSAGGYLALTSASLVSPKPKGLLLIYGMLDPADERYIRKGENIFGRPPIDTTSTLDYIAVLKKKGEAGVIAGYPAPTPPSDPRGAIIGALHVDALFPDYITGIDGLSTSIAQKGRDAIPQEHRHLYAIAFGHSTGLPPAMLLHGKNDSAVPFKLSETAAAWLREGEVQVEREFLDDAQHGFDTGVGDIDIEKETLGEFATPAFESLRHAIQFLEKVLA